VLDWIDEERGLRNRAGGRHASTVREEVLLVQVKIGSGSGHACGGVKEGQLDVCDKQRWG
jgi:hypothetical protein